MAVVYVEKECDTKYLVDFRRRKVADFISNKNIGCGTHVENDNVEFYVNHSFDSPIGKLFLKRVYEGKVVLADYIGIIEKELDNQKTTQHLYLSEEGDGIIVDWDKNLWAPDTTLIDKDIEKYLHHYRLSDAVTRSTYGGSYDGWFVKDLINFGKFIHKDCSTFVK